MKNTLSQKENDILQQIKSIEDFKEAEYKYLYELLGAKNDHVREEIEESIKLRNSTLKDRHIFDIFASRGTIDPDDIVQIWKLIVERLGEIDPEIRNNIHLDKKAIDVDVIEGELYLDQDTNKPANIKYQLGYDDLYTKNTVIVSKEAYSDLEIRKKRFLNQTDNDFVMMDILKDALAKNTSDIHIKFGRFYTVHFRIHGLLIEQKKYTMNKERYEDLVDSIAQKASKDTMLGFNANERNLPQGGIHKYNDLNVDLRIEFTPKGTQDGDVLIVARILKRGGTTGNLDKIQGYDDHFKQMLWRMTLATTGLILVAGVTNSGKSVLTSHFIMSLPSGKSIVTAEDPIEYEKPRSDTTQHQPYVVKKQGKVVAEVGFKHFMKSWKRADPDILEIGETRKDKELVEAIVEGVKAGNLVISTIHVNSSFDVPKSLVTEFGMNIASVSDILSLVVNQILVQKLCNKCKIPDINGENRKILKDFNDSGDVRYSWKKDLEDFIDGKDETFLKNEKGCMSCGYTGVEGLVPIYEYLKFNVEAVQWLGTDFIKKSRFEIEKHFCSKEDENLAINKLTTYVKALRRGDVDTTMDTLAKVLL
ncbi:MAG TPA: hypothetical protein EYH42_09580 [Sulfurovum sp.]|nr:hypothetical protein [Sulfurovum sp.]